MDSFAKVLVKIFASMIMRENELIFDIVSGNADLNRMNQKVFFPQFSNRECIEFVLFLPEMFGGIHQLPLNSLCT